MTSAWRSSDRSGLVGLFRLLLRPRRSLHRRQRLDIFGDGRAIVRGQLGGVLDHSPHRAAGAVAIGRGTGLEEIIDVLYAPVANSLLRNVRHPALAFEIG